jgi:adenylosuccinate synthase
MTMRTDEQSSFRQSARRRRQVSWFDVVSHSANQISNIKQLTVIENDALPGLAQEAWEGGRCPHRTKPAQETQETQIE